MDFVRKTIIGFLVILVCAGVSRAQIWGGGPGVGDYTTRTGAVSIGSVLSAGLPWTKLHIYSSLNSTITLSSQTGPNIRFNKGNVANNDPTNMDTDLMTIGLSVSGAKYIPTDVANDFVMVNRNSTGNILFATGSGTYAAERMRITSGGFVGIGSAFTSSVLPSRVLHIKHQNPAIFLDATGGTYPGSLIEFGSGGTSSYMINLGYYSACGSGSFRIGPSSGAGRKAINMRDNQIYFSDNQQFGGCSGVAGLSGRYLFDDQVSSTSLLVAPANVTYPIIPSGYLFSVQGNSNVNGRIQINNSTSTLPDNTIAGLNISNTTSYAWIQTENGKPLVLNPIVNTNPTTTNTSYVAIGFAPGDAGVGLPGVGYKLAVKGKVICEELKVKYSGTWPDHVFGQNYKLRGLNEVERFITENKHLPDVPSETEIHENGIEAGQMDATLLKKIEELTLYMIEMNKEIQGLKKSNETLTERNNALEKLLVK